MVNGVKPCLLMCLVAASAVAGPLPRPRVVGPEVPYSDTVDNGKTDELDSQINGGRYSRHTEEKRMGDSHGNGIADIGTATASGVSGTRSKRCAYTIHGDSSANIINNGCHVTITGSFDGQFINHGILVSLLGSKCSQEKCD